MSEQLSATQLLEQLRGLKPDEKSRPTIEAAIRLIEATSKRAQYKYADWVRAVVEPMGLRDKATREAGRGYGEEFVDPAQIILGA